MDLAMLRKEASEHANGLELYAPPRAALELVGNHGQNATASLIIEASEVRGAALTHLHYRSVRGAAQRCLGVR